MFQTWNPDSEIGFLMLPTDRISFNALRVFVAAAEAGSLKGAALRLGVTPGAVSQQVRALEQALGLALFRRGANSLHLTASGMRLARQAGPHLRGIEGALGAAMYGGAEVAVQVPVTLATRWLIPRLDGFRARHPGTRIRVDTSGQPGAAPPPEADPAAEAGCDAVLAYYPAAAVPPGAEVLLTDRCVPVLAPALLQRLGAAPPLERVPALQAARGNWDWALWLRAAGRPGLALDFAGRFDLDDAALRAAIAGLGMVLAPRFLIADDLAAGRLIPLPAAPELVLGAYVLHVARPLTGPVVPFLRWLRAAARRDGGDDPGRSLPITQPGIAGHGGSR